jgi:hypothetical protein
MREQTKIKTPVFHGKIPYSMGRNPVKYGNDYHCKGGKTP